MPAQEHKYNTKIKTDKNGTLQQNKNKQNNRKKTAIEIKYSDKNRTL